MSTRPPTCPPALSRRSFLRGTAACGAAIAVGPLLSACEPSPGERDLWRQGFTSPGLVDVTIVDHGGWCWFSESRTLIGPDRRLYAGTVASGTGTSRDGSIEITSVDVASGLRSSRGLRRSSLDTPSSSSVGWHRVDDHNNPGLVVTPHGAVMAMWSAHGTETVLRSVRSRDTETQPPTGNEGLFTLQPDIDRPDSMIYPGRGVSYATLHPVGDGTIVAAYRGEDYTWNLLRSVDDGRTWEPMGKIVVPPRIGERPYVKFAVEGRRLWFAATEGHPRTFQPTNVRAAVLDPLSGEIRSAAGGVLGHVGAGVPVLNLPVAYRCPAAADAWISEIRFIAGRPVISVSVRGQRVDSPAGAWAHDHLRVMLAGDGTWIRELVARGGGELGGNVDEPDYTGLAALDPSTHNRIVVSTNVHPATGALLRSRADGRIHFELWEMNRRSDGKWLATPITANSAVDNIRPHIAVAGRTKIVSWMRGTYRNPHIYSTSIVARQAA